MSDRYHSIIIGSGLGGLTAGALSALDGKRVLIIEQHRDIGGVSNTFRRKGREIEIGLHAIDGLDENDAKTPLLKQLGVLDKVKFERLPEIYQARSPLLGDDFTLCNGAQEALKKTIARFPKHAAGIETFFGLVNKIRAKISLISHKRGDTLFWIFNAPIAVFRFWVLGKYERYSVGQYLDQLFGDDEAVKMALCANYGYYCADPYKLSLLFFSVAQGSWLAGGAHYPVGGSRSLTEHLANVVKDGGGEIITGRRVEKILMNDGNVSGVIHVKSSTGEDPVPIEAPVVFANAAPQMIADMLPENQRELFSVAYKDKVLSTSLWVIHLALDRPPIEFGVKGYSTFIFPNWQTKLADTCLSRWFMAKPPGDRIPGYVVADYSKVNSGLSDSSHYPMSIVGMDDIANWEGRGDQAYKNHKTAWQEAILEDFDIHFPGIRAHINYCEMATAKTMARYLNAPGGTTYGFSQEPNQAGRFRPKNKTAIPGLILASAYAVPGGGFTGAMLSGQNAHHLATKHPSWSRDKT